LYTTVQAFRYVRLCTSILFIAPYYSPLSVDTAYFYAQSIHHRPGGKGLQLDIEFA